MHIISHSVHILNHEIFGAVVIRLTESPGFYRCRFWFVRI